MFAVRQHLSGIVPLLLIALRTFVHGCDQIGPAVIKGKRFFNSRDNSYLALKGINYYPRPNDGILDENGIDFFTVEYRDLWLRDLVHIKDLGVNVVRIFSVDPSKNHDAFMCALRENGMYAIVGLAAPCLGCSVSVDPAPACYPKELKERGQYIISEFSRYENLLAFSAGNEVTLLHRDAPEVNAPCQKKFLRDMKAFIQGCPDMRKIPVGVVVADYNKKLNARYFNCRTDPDDELETADFYGINIYRHKDVNDTDPMNLPGYEELLETYQRYAVPVPVVLTEFGGQSPTFPNIDGYDGQRNFIQVQTIYSERFCEEFAGGLVFEYSAELHRIKLYGGEWPFKEWSIGNFGLGYFEPEDCDDIDIPCSYVPFPEYKALKDQFEAVKTSDMPSLDEYDPDLPDIPKCPGSFGDNKLSDFEWESDSQQDWWCPDTSRTFVCESTPTDCVPGTTDEPTISPMSEPSPDQPTVPSSPTTDGDPMPSLPAPTTPAPTAGASEVPSVPTPRPIRRPTSRPTEPLVDAAIQETSRAAVRSGQTVAMAFSLIVLVWHSY